MVVGTVGRGLSCTDGLAYMVGNWTLLDGRRTQPTGSHSHPLNRKERSMSALLCILLFRDCVYATCTK